VSESDVTYEQTARWLKPEVREAIEAALPCPYTGERHDWQRYEIDVQTLSEAAPRTYVHWQCGCGRSRKTPPA
jgi:hypothetical protein